jgi:ParB-like nuclease domain
MNKREFHPLAALFPPLDEKELDELAADIREHGLREPIVTFEGKILDGRNRYLACERAGVAPRFKEYTGSDPLAYVVSLNLKRRHLDTSQRAMVAKRIETLTHGGDRRSDQDANWHLGISRERAAELMNVSERSIARAGEVQKKGADELIAAVDQGRAAVFAAAEVAKQPKDQQREIVARGDNKIAEAAKI